MAGNLSSAMAESPARAGLERLVRQAEGPAGVDFARAVVETVPRALPAEFRIDVRAMGDEFPARKLVADACRSTAAALNGLGGIARATALPPNVYLSPSTDVLGECVTDAVLSQRDDYGRMPTAEPLYYIVSFSGPNVNKPLHLGHLRNNFLGMAVANLLADKGHTVERQAPHCDWGIHIAQALLAWRKWGNGTTPESLGEKGDHFVGRHYVLFHQRATPALEAEASGLMQALEDGDEGLLDENHRFTRWADDGIQETYARIGTRMDGVFYDKDYLDEGRRLIEDGLAAGRCRRRDDSSVFIDLSAHDLGEVTLVRRDGTPTVYRQWMAVNIARYPSRPVDRIRVVTGKEWEAGIRVLRETLRALGQEWASCMEGVHYGLVVLPDGRMKSRQGSGVAADVLLDAVRDRLTTAWSKAEDAPADAADLCEALGVGVLKHMFLAAKRSRDVVYSKQLLWGEAVPRFAAVIRALREAEAPGTGPSCPGPSRFVESDRALALAIDRLPNVIDRAAAELEPAHLVRHIDDIVAGARRTDAGPRLRAVTAVALRRSLALLGIALPTSLHRLPPQFAEACRPDSST
jgi:arginyl-tRNA synthetase